VEVFWSDVRRTRIQRDYLRELNEIYHFYLDDERRERLAGMGRIRRTISLLGWLLSSLLMKLSPARRLLLLAALVFTLLLGHVSMRLGDRLFQADLRPWGFLLLLFVLALELKDKLLARDEIQIARDVQLALLPSESATIPGWTVWNCSRPANSVGGDLVDYLELDGFRHGVVLGDVAVKGLGAALLTAKLQATLRALVPEAVSLVEMGAHLNSIFYRDGLDNRFATLFYVELEHDSGAARCLNAGHNPALVVGAGGLRRIGASSLPLGMLPDTSYEEVVLALEPGDLLIAYSDGLTEATDAGDREFGMERLEALVSELRTQSPETVGQRLLTEVDRFLGESRLLDDLSIVVIRREG